MNAYIKTGITLSTAFLLASTGTDAAPRPDHCYDFSNMATDRTYTVGDVIDTEFATITIKPYVVNGAPAEAENRRAQSAPSQIAGGTSPELQLYLVALNVEPKKPVSRITTRIAQNISSTGGFADAGVGVNRKGFKSPTGFAGMDGQVLGADSTGKARISANVTPSGGGNWHSGTMEFKAVEGAIESIRLGGHTWRLDNMCFAY